MKQILQDLKTGNTVLEDVPVPVISKGKVLIKTSYSLVSLGTERMLIEFGKANLIEKAWSQPEKFKQVIHKINTDGLFPTLEAVFNKLDQPLPLGYCNVGVVEEVASDIKNFKKGDVVVSNGPHAEWVCVPKNLVAKVPKTVNKKDAVFTVIGSIGLQGLRLIKPEFGETIVVFGLGLIGLITTQLLKGMGCKVIGIELNKEKCKLAQSWGVKTLNPVNDELVESVQNLTGFNGADGVIITASSKNNQIISQAAKMSRKRGRIVLIGDIGLDINRSDFYEKELTFQVSCSYGPGRYDYKYEQEGNDYPLPFVRWTEKRNFETILDSLGEGIIETEKLISQVVPLHEYQIIYNSIDNENNIASILKYPNSRTYINDRNIILKDANYKEKKGVVGLIGAGNFTRMTMLPALKKTEAILDSIVSSEGITGSSLAKKYGFRNSSTSAQTIIQNDNIDAVLITTRHDTHAKYTIEALKNNKHVLVEKPLAITSSEISDIINAEKNSMGSVMVGFNRRFSPHVEALKKKLNGNLINITATMNAGFIPNDSWVHDPKIGGGRIIGEACHYIDLCSYLAGSMIQSVCMNSLGVSTNLNTDNASIILKFENGSNASINYFSNGSKSYVKERVEIYSQRRTYVLDNFRKTIAYGDNNFKKIKTKIDKGHLNQYKYYINWLKNGGKPIIPFSEIINSSYASIGALKSLEENRWVYINEY